MWSDEPRSLPAWIEEAYEILLSEITSNQDGISKEEAQSRLVAHETFPDDPEDAEYAIERLLNTGWLYQVQNELRITDPDA